MPLPPLGSLLVANQLPFSLGPDGVLCFVSTNMNPGWRPAQTSRLLTWEEARKIRLDGKKLFLDKEKIHAATTATRASHLFNLLSTLATLSRDDRASAIKQTLLDAMDIGRITQLRDELRARTRAIRLLVNVLFVHLFIVAPALVTLVGIQATWMGLVTVMFALTVSIATLFHRAHKALYPQSSDERFTHTLTTALAAATTLRAHDIASRPLLENFHPLAVAKVLLEGKEFCIVARSVLLDLRNPILPACPSAQPKAVAAESFFRSTSLEITEAWLKENGVSPDDLCRAPEPWDATCRAYCPRCGSQFTTAEQPCSDCGGIALVRFADKP